MTAPVLTVQNLRKEFHIRSRGRIKTLTAVDGIGFEVRPGETVALVGESGSGKSTVARCITRIVEPTAGAVHVDGKSVREATPAELSRVFADLQMVFQDPNLSLNPRMMVRAILDEPLRLHAMLSRDEREARVTQLLESVGLSTDFASRLPRQLSGGQRQRVGIARALAVDPKVVLLDEPTASLDVSVRARMLDLLARVQAEKNLGFLFISHDLAVVRKIADRVLVMYLGGIVEAGSTEEVFTNPTHPYTRALLSAAPVAEYGRKRSRFKLTGEIPSPIDLPTGCRLAGRCPMVEPSCSDAVPDQIRISETHSAACPVAMRADAGRDVNA